MRGLKMEFIENVYSKNSQHIKGSFESFPRTFPESLGESGW